MSGDTKAAGDVCSKTDIAPEILDQLLPGQETVELDTPRVAGGKVYLAVKRCFDVCACAVALVLLAIPMVVIAVKIRMESPGPVFYSQTRVGKDGRPFQIYKFRSMYVDAEAHGPQWASETDERVTPFGRRLRNSRFDEVPQFWNIIKGDMSLVGPRPERPEFCDAFEKQIHGWHYRTLVKPGLSGLAQVMGGYELLPQEKVTWDLEYIRTRSLGLDLTIIGKTIGVMFSGKGAR